MRILAICHWNLANPDAETIRKVDLNEALQALGVEVTLFAPALGRYPKKTSFPIHYIPSLGGRFAAHTYLLGLFAPLLFFLLLRRPKIIYVSDYTLSFPLLILIWLLRVKLVVEVNGVMAKDAWRLGIRDPVRLGIIKSLSKAGLSRASKLICVSKDVRQYLIDELKCSADSVIVVPNGVNTELYKPMSKEQCRRKLGLDPEHKVLGFIGSFLPWQGVERLIEASQKLIQEDPLVRLSIVGYGPLESRYRELIGELGLEGFVALPGKVSIEDSAVWVNTFDLGVHLVEPGKECSPVKLQCYMACACPVLVTKEVDGFDMVRDENYGSKVDYHDTEAITASARRLLMDAELRVKMGQRGRSAIENTSSWQHRGRETLSALKSLRP